MHGQQTGLMQYILSVHGSKIKMMASLVSINYYVTDLRHSDYGVQCMYAKYSLVLLDNNGNTPICSNFTSHNLIVLSGYI